MPTYLSPGVYVEEVEPGVRSIEGVGTAVAAFVGLARAALELTLDYTGQRRSWGRPVREHQAVALELAAMAVDFFDKNLR